MRTSHISLILVSIILVGYVGTSLEAADGTKVLSIEIRCSKGNEIKSNAGVYSALNFWTDQGAKGVPLSLMKQREDGEYRVFQQSFELKNDPARAIIVAPWNQIDQVFLLSLPHKLKQSDWTNWQHPNYVETNADSNFRFAYIPPDRSTNIPPNSFELRYKVELP